MVTHKHQQVKTKKKSPNYSLFFLQRTRIEAAEQFKIITALLKTPQKIM